MRIEVTVNGTTHQIVRSVCHNHPTEVHAALGTASEEELQRCLDGLDVSDWYGPDGRHLGPDACGMSMYRD